MIQMFGMKNLIIKLLEFLVFISFFLVIIGITFFLENTFRIDYIWGAIIGILISTLTHGVIILSIQNNELLKDIKESQYYLRTMSKTNQDLFKEIKDNTKK